jgi:GNAT superfamily N-acetyltransferase
MKFFKIISHPYTLIICFLMIMISGEHLGGFYALYILLALPFGGVHAFLAIGGIVILLVTHKKLQSKGLASVLLNYVGVLLLFLSLYYFFWADKKHYNWGTFDQTVPVLTMILTAFVAVCFLIRTTFFSVSKDNVVAIL